MQLGPVGPHSRFERLLEVRVGVVPEACRREIRRRRKVRRRAGDFATARDGLFRLLPLNPLMYEESNPVGVKAALEALGVCGAAVRLPLLEATEGLKERIRKAL